MVKKRSSAKPKSCMFNVDCHCKIFLLKIAVIATVLFLMRIWPRLTISLLKVHWGWYLGIIILTTILLLPKTCWCGKK